MTLYIPRVLYRPGHRMSDDALTQLHAELLELAAMCFDDLVPVYQVLTGDRAIFERAVLVIARDPDTGALMGFSSSLLLPVPGVGDVMHLGLLCVHPDARSSGLSHSLMGVGAFYHIMRQGGRTTWFSNLACVVSSLANVGQYFEDVFPSPHTAAPSDTHRAIARELFSQHKGPLYIDPDATLDDHAFVVRDSVPDTPFQKDAQSEPHRDPRLDAFYRGLMRFEHGDEVLQIGHASALSALRYAATHGLRFARRRARKLLRATPRRRRRQAA